MTDKQENTNMKYISKDPIKEFEVSSKGNTTHLKCKCLTICGCYICGCYKPVDTLLTNLSIGNYRGINDYKIIQQKDPVLGNVYNLYTKDLKKILSKISSVSKHNDKDYYYIICLDNENVASIVILMKNGEIYNKLTGFQSFTHVLKNGNIVITSTVENKLAIIDDELNLIKKLEFTPRCYEHPDIYPVTDPTGHGTFYYNSHTMEIIDKISNSCFVFWNGNKAYEHKSDGVNGAAPYWLQTREFIKKDDLNKHSMNCSICMLTIDKQTCLIPCGHSQFCAKCIEKLSSKTDSKATCPICQKTITSTLRIFLN